MQNLVYFNPEDLGAKDNLRVVSEPECILSCTMAEVMIQMLFRRKIRFQERDNDMADLIGVSERCQRRLL